MQTNEPFQCLRLSKPPVRPTVFSSRSSPDDRPGREVVAFAEKRGLCSLLNIATRLMSPSACLPEIPNAPFTTN